jgi:hypothetical protein
MDELTRAFEFERRRLERLSTRLERFEFGVAYLDEEYRQRYFSNFLLADKKLNDASVEALIAAGERILGEAGYEHRLIILRDGRWAERIAHAFQAHGFSTLREVTMTHRRDPDRDAALRLAERFGGDNLHPHRIPDRHLVEVGGHICGDGAEQRQSVWRRPIRAPSRIVSGRRRPIDRERDRGHGVKHRREPEVGRVTPVTRRERTSGSCAYLVPGDQVRHHR